MITFAILLTLILKIVLGAQAAASPPSENPATSPEKAPSKPSLPECTYLGMTVEHKDLLVRFSHHDGDKYQIKVESTEKPGTFTDVDDTKALFTPCFKLVIALNKNGHDPTDPDESFKTYDMGWDTLEESDKEDQTVKECLKAIKTKNFGLLKKLGNLTFDKSKVEAVVGDKNFLVQVTREEKVIMQTHKYKLKDGKLTKVKTSEAAVSSSPPKAAEAAADEDNKEGKILGLAKWLFYTLLLGAASLLAGIAVVAVVYHQKQQK